MPNYAVTAEENAVTAAFLTAASLTRGASKRAKLYDIKFSHAAAPADTAIHWDLSRHTVAPTVTAVTPLPLDTADGAAVTAAGEAASAEGTVTADSAMLDFDLNQRTTWRWVAAPRSEIVIADAAGEGLSVRALSPSYTGIARVSMMFEE